MRYGLHLQYAQCGHVRPRENFIFDFNQCQKSKFVNCKLEAIVVVGSIFRDWFYYRYCITNDDRDADKKLMLLPCGFRIHQNHTQYLKSQLTQNSL